MTFEIDPPEVYALADTLRRSAGAAEEIGTRLAHTPHVGGGLQAAVEEFLAGQRVAGRALAGELTWLGTTIAGVADSWLGLDRELLADSGRVDLR
ncbi:MAG: hypothetical protein ACXVXT_08585 [Blastococcus sp.]